MSPNETWYRRDHYLLHKAAAITPRPTSISNRLEKPYDRNRSAIWRDRITCPGHRLHFSGYRTTGFTLVGTGPPGLPGNEEADRLQPSRKRWVLGLGVDRPVYGQGGRGTTVPARYCDSRQEGAPGPETRHDGLKRWAAVTVRAGCSRISSQLRVGCSRITGDTRCRISLADTDACD